MDRTGSRCVRALVALAIVALGLAEAAGATEREHIQTVDGTIEMPSIRGSNAFRAARCAWLERGAESQGKLGRLIRLRGASDEILAFTLRGPHARGKANDAIVTEQTFDVAFYYRLGTCDEDVRPMAVASGSHGRTHGWVPFGARYALVVHAAVRYWTPQLTYGGWRGGLGASVSDDPGPQAFRFRTARPTGR